MTPGFSVGCYILIHLTKANRKAIYMYYSIKLIGKFVQQFRQKLKICLLYTNQLCNLISSTTICKVKPKKLGENIGKICYLNVERLSEFLSFSSFGSTQGLTFSTQALYHLSHASSPFIALFFR
jgi:hypothetical protein